MVSTLSNQYQWKLGIWEDPVMFDQENYQRFDSSKIRVYAWYKDASNKNITITGSTEERLKRYYSQGYEAVRCDCFYLNYISYGNNEDWKDYLNCPLTDYAVGGEISMWGEYVDATNLEHTCRKWCFEISKKQPTK